MNEIRLSELVDLNAAQKMVDAHYQAAGMPMGIIDALDDSILLVTDMTMPNMTGDQLAREITSIRSDIPVIACSGFSERIDREGIMKFGIRAVLMKPIIKSRLAHVVRTVLDKGDA